MNYGDIATEIATEASGSIDPAQVDLFALGENEEDFNNPEPGKTQVIILVNSGEYGNTFSTDTINQEVILLVQVSLRGRVLFGAGGIYDTEHKIRQAIVGFEPTNCEKLVAKNLQMHQAGIDGADWSFSATYTTKSINQQQFIEVPAGTPLITEINYEEDFTTS